jgi:hypothetical protein
MEVEIRLRASRLLLGLHVVVVSLACIAITLCVFPLVIQLSGIVIVISLSVYDWRGHSQVAGLCLKSHAGKQGSDDDECHEQTARVAGVVSLADGRLVEVALRSMYCLWWLQVLVLQSHDKARTVVVLPDSSSREQRRLLRKLSAF